MSRLDRLHQLGIDLYPSRSARTHTIREAIAYGCTGEELVIAGRLISADPPAFSGVVQDATGRIEFRLSPESDQSPVVLYNELIPGDIIECTGWADGTCFMVRRMGLLVPSLGACPESVPESAVTLKADVLRFTRRFFETRGFVAADTPYFMNVPDLTPAITSFETACLDASGKTRPFYLQTSPEHYMKRLLVSGYERIYQICRFFRNGERFKTHHPEFTGLEWYQAYADYNDVMRTTEEYIASLAVAVCGASSFQYQGQRIDFSPPWPRKTVRDALWEAVHIDLRQCETPDRFRHNAEMQGITVGEDDSWDDMFHRMFIQYVEPQLPADRPMFLIEYPAQLPSLARPVDGDNRFVERFELYIGGLELANAFTELNDPAEQRDRFESQRKIKQEKDGYAGGIDEAFLAALAWGMPPAGGIALGLDRLMMLFADTASIDAVIAFRDY